MILFTLIIVPLLNILGCQVSNELYDTVYGIVESPLVVDLSEYFSGESNYYFLDGPGEINQITSTTYSNLNYNIIDFSLQNIMNDPLVQKGGQIAILGQNADNYYVILDNTITNYTTLNSISFTIQNNTQCFQIAFMNFNDGDYVIVSCALFNVTTQQQFLIFNQSNLLQTPKVISVNQTISQIINQTIQTTQQFESDFYFLGVLSYTSSSSICYIYNISSDLNIKLYTYHQNVTDFYISSISDIFTLNKETGITINYNDNSESVNFNPYPNQYISFNVFELLIQPTVRNYYLGIATINGMSSTLIIDYQFTTTTSYSWGYQGNQIRSQGSILITPQYLIGSNGYSLIIYPGPRNQINNQQSLFNVHLAAQVKFQYNLQSNYLYVALINENIWGSNQLINPYYIDIPTLNSISSTIKISARDVFGNVCHIVLNYNILYETDTFALPTRSQNVPLILEDYKSQKININKYFCGPSLSYPSIAFSTPQFESLSLQQYGQIQLVSNNPTYAQLFALIEIGYLPSIILMEYYNENPQIDISVCQPTYQYCKLYQSIYNSTYTTINSLAIGSKQSELVVAVNLGEQIDIYQVNLVNATFITTLTTGSAISSVQIAGGYIFLISTPSIIYQLSDYQEVYDDDDESVQINEVFWNFEAYGNQFFINSVSNCKILQISQNSVIVIEQLNQPILGITQYGYYYLNATSGQLMFQSRIPTIPSISVPTYGYTLQADFVGQTSNHFYIMAAKDNVYYILVYQLSNSIYGILYYMIPLPLQSATFQVIGKDEFDILLILNEGEYSTYILYHAASVLFVPTTQFHANEEEQVANLIITVASMYYNPYEQYIKLVIIDSSSYLNRIQIDQIFLTPEMPESLLYSLKPSDYILGNIYNYQLQYNQSQLNAILINPINLYQQYNGVSNPLGVNFYENTYIVNNEAYYVFKQEGPEMGSYQEIFNISQFINSTDVDGDTVKVITSFIEFYTKFVVFVFQSNDYIEFQELNLGTMQPNPNFITQSATQVENVYYMNGIVLIYINQEVDCYLQVGIYISQDDLNSNFQELIQISVQCQSIYSPLNISMGANISAQVNQQFGFLTYDEDKFEMSVYSFQVMIGNNISNIYGINNNQENTTIEVYQQSFTLIQLVGNNQVSQVYDIIQIDYPSFSNEFFNIVPLLLTSTGFSYQVNLQFINGKNNVIINPTFNCYFQGYEMNFPKFVQASNGIVSIIYQVNDQDYDSIFNYGNYSEQCSSGSTVYSIAYASTVAPNYQYLSIYAYPYFQLIGVNSTQDIQMIYLSPQLNVGILPSQQSFQGNIQFNITVHSLYNFQTIQVLSNYSLTQGTIYAKPSSSEWAFLWGSILFLAITIPLGYLCWKSRS